MIEKFQDINSKYLKKILNANIEYVAQKNRESLLSYNEEEPIYIVKI